MERVCSDRGRGASSVVLLLAWLFAGTAAPAQDGNLVVADFEGGKVETLLGLALIVIADEQLGGLSEARLALSHPGAQASRGAMRISFRVADGFAYPFSSVWAILGAEGLATDLSAYRGLRFYARSQGGTFQAGVGQFSGGQPKRYMASFEAKPEWTLVEVPFDKLQLSPPTGAASAFVPKDLTSIGFSAPSRLRGEVDLEIDQLEVYK